MSGDYWLSKINMKVRIYIWAQAYGTQTPKAAKTILVIIIEQNPAAVWIRLSCCCWLAFILCPACMAQTRVDEIGNSDFVNGRRKESLLLPVYFLPNLPNHTKSGTSQWRVLECCCVLEARGATLARPVPTDKSDQTLTTRPAAPNPSWNQSSADSCHWGPSTLAGYVGRFAQ